MLSELEAGGDIVGCDIYSNRPLNTSRVVWYSTVGEVLPDREALYVLHRTPTQNPRELPVNTRSAPTWVSNPSLPHTISMLEIRVAHRWRVG